MWQNPFFDNYDREDAFSFLTDREEDGCRIYLSFFKNDDEEDFYIECLEADRETPFRLAAEDEIAVRREAVAIALSSKIELHKAVYLDAEHDKGFLDSVC